MPMNISYAPSKQILKELCMFQLWQSRAPLPSHWCPRALSLGSASLKLSYLLAHTSNWGALEYSRIRTPWVTHSSWPYSHLGPITNGVTSLGYHFKVPLVPMVFQALLMERCATSGVSCMILNPAWQSITKIASLMTESQPLQLWRVKCVTSFPRCRATTNICNQSLSQQQYKPLWSLMATWDASLLWSSFSRVTLSYWRTGWSM